MDEVDSPLETLVSLPLSWLVETLEEELGVSEALGTSEEFEEEGIASPQPARSKGSVSANKVSEVFFIAKSSFKDNFSLTNLWRLSIHYFSLFKQKKGRFSSGKRITA
jgi:hypothetical protein